MRRVKKLVLPGEILLEEFLKPMNISQYRLAKDIGVSQIRISQIVHGKRGISTDTGLRLSKYFGLTEGFWIGLQKDYEIRMAKYDPKVRRALSQVKKIKRVG